MTSRTTRFSMSGVGSGTLVTYPSAYAYRPDGRFDYVDTADGARSRVVVTPRPFNTPLVDEVTAPGRHGFAYDARGLLATQSSFEGLYTYGYDEVGRNTLLVFPDGHERRQVWDDVGRLTSRCYVYPDAPSLTRCYGASYDAVGNPVELTDPEGRDVFTYDALDRLASVTRFAPSGAVVWTEGYDFNALGALTRNANGVLDHQRPRLGGGGVADAAVPNTFGAQPVTLDAGGRVTSLQGTTLAWDTSGTLTRATGPDGSTLDVGYDASGRRVWNLRRSSAGTVVSKRHFVHEGSALVAVLGDDQPYPTTAPVLASFLYDGIDHPLRLGTNVTNIGVDANTGVTEYTQTPVVLAYYELDLAGNVRRLRQPGGFDLGGYRFSAFGQTLEETVNYARLSANTFHSDQPLGWKGRPLEDLAGVAAYDMRARWWKPETGTFLSIDEFAFHDRKSTLWGWPGQNPLRWSDPSGHYAFGFETVTPLLTEPLAPGGSAALEAGLAVARSGGYFGLFTVAAGAIIGGATFDILTQLDELEHPTITYGSNAPNGGGSGVSCPPPATSSSEAPAPQPQAAGGGAGKRGGRGSGSTRMGIARNNPRDWRDWRDVWDATGNGDVLSAANRELIASGQNPVVDAEWIAAFPGHAAYLGESITIHHIAGSPITVPLPGSAHRDAHMPGGFRYNPGGTGDAY